MEYELPSPPVPTGKTPPLRRSPRLNPSPKESTESPPTGSEGKQSTNNNSPCAGAEATSDPYAKIIIKIYNDHQLYSIFDHGTKRYIYHSKHDCYKDHTVSFSEDGYCDAVYDSKGVKVYEKPKRAH
ncbi:hypothetical protein F4803DRAFT_554532 [Xylaria telfairii]|nr:hypothetical protein F4803DRAFT_554532 [Xylaria telfairii]